MTQKRHKRFFICLAQHSQLTSPQLQELVYSTREYLLAMILENTRKDWPADDHKRQLELAAYFTHCKLLPQHATLALRRGIQAASKAKNYATAARFARRLVELNPSDKQTVAKVCYFCPARASLMKMALGKRCHRRWRPKSARRSRVRV